MIDSYWTHIYYGITKEAHDRAVEQRGKSFTEQTMHKRAQSSPVPDGDGVIATVPGIESIIGY